MRHIRQYQTETAIQTDLDNRDLRQPYIAELPGSVLDYNSKQATFSGGGAADEPVRKRFDGGGAFDNPVPASGAIAGMADKFIIEGKTKLVNL